MYLTFRLKRSEKHIKFFSICIVVELETTSSSGLLVGMSRRTPIQSILLNILFWF